MTKAAFPEWVKAPVSYGPRLPAAASYWKVHQHGPYERMANLLLEALKTRNVAVEAGRTE